MPTERQAHWRELQTLRRKYYKAKRENSVGGMEDYADGGHRLTQVGAPAPEEDSPMVAGNR